MMIRAFDFVFRYDVIFAGREIVAAGSSTIDFVEVRLEFNL